MKNATLSRWCTFFFMFLLALSDSLFGLIDVDAVNIRGVFNLDMIWQILAVGFAVYLYWKVRNASHAPMSGLNICVMLLLVSCVIAALQCTLITGQSFLRGILPQRVFMVSLICAFLLSGTIIAKVIDVNRIIDLFLFIGTIVGMSYIFQAMTGIEIFHVMQNERYGSVRLYMQSCFPDIAGFIGLWRLLKTGRIKYILPAFLAIFLSVFVSKGRLELIALLVTYLLIFFVIRKSADIKFYLMILVSACFILFLSSSYGAKLLANFSPNSVEDDTTSIRKQGRLLYSSQLHESVTNRLFGCGYPNALYRPAAHRAGLDQGILLGDNGVFAFNYVYGALGLVSIICIAIFIFRFAVRNLNTEVGLFCFSFLSFSVVACANIAWWWYSGAWPMTFALVICCAQMMNRDDSSLFPQR